MSSVLHMCNLSYSFHPLTVLDPWSGYSNLSIEHWRSPSSKCGCSESSPFITTSPRSQNCWFLSFFWPACSQKTAQPWSRGTWYPSVPILWLCPCLPFVTVAFIYTVRDRFPQSIFPSVLYWRRCGQKWKQLECLVRHWDYFLTSSSFDATTSIFYSPHRTWQKLLI